MAHSDPADERQLAKAAHVLASQRTELVRLRQANKRLTRGTGSLVGIVRRAPALTALTQATQQFSQPKGRVVLSTLTPPLLLGRQMGAAVVALLREMTIETRAMVKGLSTPETEPQLSQAMDAPSSPDGRTVAGRAQLRIDALKAKYAQRFATLAQEWARRMIGGVVAQSSAQLGLGLKDIADRMAIQSTMATSRMRAVVEAATFASTDLITRIPAKYLGDVQVQVMSAITTGSGLDKLVPYLTKRYKGDARHAHLTALDQVRKVSETVNATRLQTLGVEEYVWMHTGGERYPRKLHQSYSGKTFRYDDPPIIDESTGVRGKPGDAIGCRCRQRPVLNFMKMKEAA